MKEPNQDINTIPEYTKHVTHNYAKNKNSVIILWYVG